MVKAARSWPCHQCKCPVVAAPVPIATPSPLTPTHARLAAQHKENLRVTVEGANNGGLLSRLNGLSLFVPVSQLEKKGHNEWWTEQVGGQWGPEAP